MQDGKLAPLHLGTCLQDLKSHYDVHPGRNPKLLCKTAPKLLQKAEQARLDGDEEVSYVFYMKYISALELIRQKKDSEETCCSFINTLKKAEMLNAFDHVETLSQSLQERYEKKLKDKAIQSVVVVEKPVERQPQPQIKKEEVCNGLPDSSEVSISCTKLYELLKQKNLKILILDARPAPSYNESHMKFPASVISVPEDIIRPGVSASTLEGSLPVQSRELWSKRKHADLVVLLDWSSNISEALMPGSKLFILKIILLRWDPEIIYKTSPLILEGGFEDWLLKYPAYTTNAQAKPPSQKKSNNIDDLLDNIEYPTLNEQIIISPKSSPLFPAVNRLSKPSIDRHSKAMALQIYEDRANAVQKLLKEKQENTTMLVELEERRLKAEEDWESLRLTKEKEAEEEMKQILQEREEQLIQTILGLEKLQMEKDTENQTLRDELDEYKKKEQVDKMQVSDASRVKQEEELNAKIRMKEEEKRKISTLREEKTKERQRRVAEEKSNRHDYFERERLAREQLAQERAKQADEKKLQEARLKEEEEERRAREKEEQHRLALTKSHEIMERDKGTYLAPLRDVPSGGSTMKRSHSSPNIAQLEDDDVTIRQKVPQFDRAIKPLQPPLLSEIRAARQRNFNPVYGCMGSGLTGLKNLGNTCYMNSIIQCLNNTTPLVSYFCKGVYHEDINRQNVTRGEVAEEVAVVIRALWSGQYRSIAIRDLRNVVGQHRDQFQTNQQQDSNEFLTILMEWLHEDLKTPGKATAKSELRELNEWEKQWKQFYSENTSYIVSLFYGMQKSTVRCLRCKEESVRYETFSNLTLPLPSNTNRCTLEDCVTLYLRGEQISGWKCPSCKEQRDAIKKLDIIKLPPILIIHFKRFYMEGWCRKQQTFVDFPLMNLDMTKHSALRDQKNTNYDLYGVSNHYGTMEGGHYTAYCRSQVYRKWYKFDDQEVSDISSTNVKSGAAYILFYASSSSQRSDCT